MTITPTAATPAVLPAGPDPATPGTGAAVPGDFLALVQQALTAALGGTPTGAGAAPAGAETVATGAKDATADAATGQPGEGTAADAALAAAAAGLVAVVTPAPAPAPPVAAAATESPTNVAGAPVGATPARPQLAGVPTGPHDIDGKAGPDGVAGDAAAALPVTAPAAGAAHPGDAGTGTPADPGAAEQAPAAPATVTVATTTPVAAPTAPLTTGAPAQPAPVTGQVFPEVTSLVTRGDGTHRITLTLKPEALGEVRVVMTVRDGSVHVRLAAGHEAQQALLAGSSELSRLLEHAGATETRIVVRDLAGAAPTTGSSNDRGADLGQASGSSLGAGDNRSQDQHAGTRAREHTQHHATDGTHDTTTAGATPSRPVQPATRTRTAGVDVTM